MSLVRIRFKTFSNMLFCLYVISENLSLFEGDILLTPEEKFAIDNDLDPQSVASFGASKRKRWTEGIVPYTIADSLSMFYIFTLDIRSIYYSYIFRIIFTV